MSETIWKQSFAKILSSTVHLFSIQVAQMADEVASESTIRKWMSGKRFPYAVYQQKLLEYLRKRLSAEHSKGDYETLYDQIEDALSDVALNTARVLRKESNGNISELVIGAMHLCFMKANEEVTERRTDKNCEVKQLIDKSSRIDIKEYPFKAVVFDFDGTLTKDQLNRTTWEAIWMALGYDVSLCKKYHKEFNEGLIDHAEWCKITEDYFKKKFLHKQILDNIADKIEILPGTHDVFKILNDNNIGIYIVSGSILHIIKRALRQNYEFLNGIQANQLVFNQQRILEKIEGTKYDFEGKARYIREIAEQLGISTTDILFVGNSLNDEYAYISGAKTLCINPRATQESNRRIWNYCIKSCPDLRDILKYIDIN